MPDIRWLIGLAFSLILSGLASAKELRDPFEFAPWRDDVTHISKDSGPPLIGVLWGEKDPLAIVGEETVAVGDRIGGWQIVTIEQDAIVVERGGYRQTVRLGQRLPGNE